MEVSRLRAASLYFCVLFYTDLRGAVLTPSQKYCRLHQKSLLQKRSDTLSLFLFSCSYFFPFLSKIDTMFLDELVKKVLLLAFFMVL